MDKLQFKLEIFEGPLDLLLHLIAKHKLNIYDIEISSLLDQYLDYIGDMRAADLEVASEFLEMAAHLVYIKTVSLLPQPEEAEELKKELTGQLIELTRLKEAARRLAALREGYAVYVRRPVVLEEDPTYRHIHPSRDIYEAYLRATGKTRKRLPPPPSAFSEIVTRRMISVTSRIVYVLKRLYKEGRIEYQDLFNGSGRSEMVATFLAMLELLKAKRIRLSEDNRYVFFNR
ncbi:MAG TPA: segregation/condensation protein A [Firmicutes bacterium]|nr:segregation/condensation protein A [Bacillota bacterium]